MTYGAMSKTGLYALAPNTFSIKKPGIKRMHARTRVFPTVATRFADRINKAPRFFVLLEKAFSNNLFPKYFHVMPGLGFFFFRSVFPLSIIRYPSLNIAPSLERDMGARSLPLSCESSSPPWSELTPVRLTSDLLQAAALLALRPSVGLRLGVALGVIRPAREAKKAKRRSTHTRQPRGQKLVSRFDDALL